MKIFSEPDFLKKGSAQLPNYASMTGVGIHSSSEVDSCTISGVRLGVKGIVPVLAGAEIRAERRAFQNTVVGPALDFVSPADGNPAAGNKLVLQIYECEEFNIPGPRTTYVSRSAVTTLPTTRLTARGMAVVPMSGRNRCAITWTAGQTTCTVNTAGVRSLGGVAGLQSISANFGHMIVNATDYTTPMSNYAPAGPQFTSANPMRTIYIDNESFDYVLIWAWDTAGSYIDLLAEASGERLQ